MTDGWIISLLVGFLFIGGLIGYFGASENDCDTGLGIFVGEVIGLVAYLVIFLPVLLQ